MAIIEITSLLGSLEERTVSVARFGVKVKMRADTNLSRSQRERVPEAEKNSQAAHHWDCLNRLPVCLGFEAAVGSMGHELPLCCRPTNGKSE
jgi:hypothetical protein